jgi:hypothetical protein
VTYADDKTSHLKVEFSFDVAEVAKGNYAPQAYHDFIGFEVEKDVLQRAFVRTYSLESEGRLRRSRSGAGHYRRAVSVLIPEMTRIAWHLKKDEWLLQASAHDRQQASVRLQPVARRAIARSGRGNIASRGLGRGFWPS